VRSLPCPQKTTTLTVFPSFYVFVIMDKDMPSLAHPVPPF
jgi:hypothetical protein